MKSPQQDRKLQTSCKNCTFAIYDGITQTGCSANRIEKFDQSDIIEAYDNEKEFYVINKFCNLYRSQSWNGGQPDLDKALIESSLDFDIMINCNSIDTDFKNYIAESIQNLCYYKDKIIINLFHDHKAASEIKSRVLEIYSKFKTIKISVCLDSDLFLHESVLKSKRNCHVVIKDTTFDFNCLYRLNDTVNNHLKKFICANNNGNTVISNMAYKMNYANHGVDNYGSNIQQIVETSKNIGMYIDI